MKVVFIFAWHLTPCAKAYYGAGEVVVVEYGTTIEATTITLDAIATLIIINVYQLKTMLYLLVLQSTQLQIVVEVVLKGPTSLHQPLNLPQT